MNRKKRIINRDDVLDLDVFNDVWLPVGDNKQMDIDHLIEQGRLTK